jgi:hypothetical protein
METATQPKPRVVVPLKAATDYGDFEEIIEHIDTIVRLMSPDDIAQAMGDIVTITIHEEGFCVADQNGEAGEFEETLHAIMELADEEPLRNAAGSKVSIMVNENDWDIGAEDYEDEDEDEGEDE